MNEKILNKNDLYKGYDFWLEQIKGSGIYEQLSFFNDIVTEKRPPHPDSEYHLVVKDVVLDDKKCDIYHTDQDENGDYIEGHTWHRIFIYIKE